MSGINGSGHGDYFCNILVDRYITVYSPHSCIFNSIHIVFDLLPTGIILHFYIGRCLRQTE